MKNVKILKGKDLIFISHISRDGSGTTPVAKVDHLDDEYFVVTCLSLTMQTFIASAFNSWVVKLKNPKKFFSPL